MRDWIFELYVKERVMTNIKVFTKQGCPPCVKLKEIISDIPNVEFLDAMGHASEYGLRQAPTTIIFKNGVEVQRFVGVKTKAEIEEILKSSPAN
jgi:thioredoxin-like negative regulator of GroEL